MVLLDVVIFAGLCWLPVGLYALGHVTGMDGWLLWLATVVTVLLGPVQFALEVAPSYRTRAQLSELRSNVEGQP